MDALSVDVHAAEGVEPLVEPVLVEDAVRFALREEGVAAAELSIALLDDAEIERMNREFLAHDGPTDVISFEIPGPPGVVVGDVYIGMEQAVRQARELGVDAAEEVLRLAVHGTLHVLGYDHPEGDDRDGSPMYLRQEALLRAYRAVQGG